MSASLKRLKREAIVVYLVARDPRMPLWIRLFAMAVAAYAFSPIDLIPDFIPVIGLLDDLLLIPLGVAVIMRFAPESVARDARQHAKALSERPVSVVAAVVVVCVWLLLIVFILSVLASARS